MHDDDERLLLILRDIAEAIACVGFNASQACKLGNNAIRKIDQALGRTPKPKRLKPQATPYRNEDFPPEPGGDY